MSFNMNLNKGAAGGNIGPTMTGSNKIPKGFSHGQLNQFTPQQHELFSRLFGQVGQGSYLDKLAGGGEEGFGAMEERAGRDFQGAMGNVASRFSGMGSGARRSSGFQQATNQASQDFASQLSEKRQGYQRQALQDLMEMSGQLLQQKPYESFMLQNAPKEPSFLKQLGLGLVGAGGQIGGQIAGRRWG